MSRHLIKSALLLLGVLAPIILTSATWRQALVKLLVVGVVGFLACLALYVWLGDYEDYDR